MTTALNRYATQGNHFVAQLATELDTPDNPTHALRTLRAVFHSIRKHLTPAASMHLLAHLPVAVKGIYVDGWNLDYPRQQFFDYEEFIDEVYKTTGGLPQKAFCRKSDVESAVQAVFRTLRYNLEEEDYHDMMGYMPIALRLYLNSDYVLEGQSYFF